ncbi:MAG: isocitrate/isopropylmalate family dehydrogenase [Saprospiraceae bacterium]
MKFTEGGFMDWGYDLAKGSITLNCWTEGTVDEASWWSHYQGCHSRCFLQQILLRPEEYDVIATLNLNGDYISDALAAQVGGIGIAQEQISIMSVVMPFLKRRMAPPLNTLIRTSQSSSVILSGVMMLDYMGWTEASALIIKGLELSIREKRVTYDFHRLMTGATLLKCSEFGDEIIRNM